MQGKLPFSTLLARNEGTIDDSRKRFGCYEHDPSDLQRIHLTVGKWPDESRYSGVLPPVLENVRRAISRDPTHCPWVSEDGKRVAFYGC